MLILLIHLGIGLNFNDLAVFHYHYPGLVLMRNLVRTSGGPVQRLKDILRFLVAMF